MKIMNKLYENIVFITRIEYINTFNVEDNRKNIYGEYNIKEILIDLFKSANLDNRNFGSPNWNPLGEIIKPGDCVLIKPNWVSHENKSGNGLDCLVTNALLLKNIIDFVIRAMPARIVIGDAPVQGCDIRALFKNAGYEELVEYYKANYPYIEWKDFRAKRLAKNNQRSIDLLDNVRDSIIFDLGEESLLEPISKDYKKFRVTMYNPALMREVHRPGKHLYSIARDAIEANVIINLPKLKTHKKAGISAAIKNFIGVNTDKDYLPHHRKGGSKNGGDCYHGSNIFKSVSELLLDLSNSCSGILPLFFSFGAKVSYFISRATGEDNNLEGNWYGNDTIWRTCLDINRIIMYGKPDGTLAEDPQRKILTITDAIICGEGEGPLAPSPYPLGIITMSMNPVAADYVHAYLMGYDWRKIHIISEGFAKIKYPLTNFGPEDIAINNGNAIKQPWPPITWRPFLAPKGWRGHCEKLI